MPRADEAPKINTFTSSSAKRLSDEKLLFSEMYPHEAAAAFGSDISNGLSSKKVKKNRKEYGGNRLSRPVPLSFKESIKKQTKNLITLFYVFASVIVFAFTKDPMLLVMTGGIVFMTLFNAIAEHWSGLTLANMQKLTSPTANVVRDGRAFLTDSRSLVCGDVVLLEQGNIVPADCRLIESNELWVLETPVNGVQTPVKKDARFLEDNAGNKKVSQNMVYAGCIITSGTARAIVCKVGGEVLISRILTKRNQPNLPKILTVVQRLCRAMPIAAVMAELMFMLCGLLGTDGFTTIFMVTLAMGTLTMSDTVFAFSALVFAKGIRLLYSKGVLVRNFDCFTRLISVNTVMCDKQIAFPPARIEIGNIYNCFDTFSPNRANRDEISDIIKKYLLCSSLKLKLGDNKAGKSPEITERYSGNVFSLSLMESAEQLGMSYDDMHSGFYRIESEYDNKGEINRTLGLLGDKNVVILKGNPENVISRCAGYRQNGVNVRFDERSKRKALDFAEYISTTQTPVAIAVGSTAADTLRDITAERKLVLIGFIGFYTSMTLESASAVYKCTHAGIETVVSTNDSYYTALNLAKSAGIIGDESQICTAEILHDTEEGLFIANAGRYKVFQGLNDSEWLYIARLRHSNGRKIALSASRLQQIPAMKEADVTFVPRKGTPDTLLHSADIQIINEGYDAIAHSLKIARLVLKRITNSSEYFLVGFCTMVFWALSSVIAGGGIPFSVRDVFLFGTVINLIFGISVSFTPLVRNILDEPPPLCSIKFFSSNTVMPVIYSVVSGLLCETSSFIIQSYSGTGAIEAGLTTFVSVMFFYSLMCGTRHSVFINKGYLNYMAFLMAIVAALLYASFMYIPAVAGYLGYSGLPGIIVLIALGIGAAFFMVLQIIMLIIENKNKTSRERKIT